MSLAIVRRALGLRVSLGSRLSVSRSASYGERRFRGGIADAIDALTSSAIDELTMLMVYHSEYLTTQKACRIETDRRFVARRLNDVWLEPHKRVR